MELRKKISLDAQRILKESKVVNVMDDSDMNQLYGGQGCIVHYTGGGGSGSGSSGSGSSGSGSGSSGSSGSGGAHCPMGGCQFACTNASMWG